MRYRSEELRWYFSRTLPEYIFLKNRWLLVLHFSLFLLSWFFSHHVFIDKVPSLNDLKFHPGKSFFDSNKFSLNQRNLCIAIRSKKDFFNSKAFLGCLNENILEDKMVSWFNKKFSLYQEIFCWVKENFVQWNFSSGVICRYWSKN